MVADILEYNLDSLTNNSQKGFVRREEPKSSGQTIALHPAESFSI
jgi:hypothetical protein